MNKKRTLESTDGSSAKLPRLSGEEEDDGPFKSTQQVTTTSGKPAKRAQEEPILLSFAKSSVVATQRDHLSGDENDDEDEDEEEDREEIIFRGEGELATDMLLSDEEFEEVKMYDKEGRQLRSLYKVVKKKQEIFVKQENTDDGKGDRVIDLVDLVSTPEPAQSSARKGVQSSSEPKPKYKYEFRGEAFNNVPDDSKGGLPFDLKTMYASLKAKRQLKGDATSHVLINNLEGLLFMLAQAALIQQEGQQPLPVQQQLICQFVSQLYEQMPKTLKWRQDLFIHFDENEGLNPSNQKHEFRWPVEFCDHMSALLSVAPRKATVKKNSSSSAVAAAANSSSSAAAISEDNEAEAEPVYDKSVLERGKSIINKCADMAKEIRNFASVYYPDRVASGDTKNTTLFKLRGKLFVESRKKTILQNLQKRRSDKKKERGDEDQENSDNLKKRAVENWKDEWEKRNCRFDEEWFPRYWLYFLFFGAPAPEKDRKPNALTTASAIQLGSNLSRNTRRMQVAAAAGAVQKIYNRSEEVAEELFPEEKTPKSNSSSRKTAFSSESKESSRSYSHSVAHTHTIVKNDYDNKLERIEVAREIIKIQRDIITDLDNRVPADEDEEEKIRTEKEKARELIIEFQKEVTQLGRDIVLKR